MRRRGKILVIMLLAAALAGGGWLAWRHYFPTYHLATVQAGVLYRDGVHSARQFEWDAQRVQPKTVVALVDDREIAQPPFTDELAICQRRGIEVIRIPIALGGWPDEGQVRQFLQIVEDKSKQPVLVHCAQGVRRTGMMVAAYQRSVLKFDKDQARNSILAFGHSDRTIGDVKRFIDLYDPDSRRLSETPAAGDE